VAGSPHARGPALPPSPRPLPAPRRQPRHRPFPARGHARCSRAPRQRRQLLHGEQSPARQGHSAAPVHPSWQWVPAQAAVPGSRWAGMGAGGSLGCPCAALAAGFLPASRTLVKSHGPTLGAVLAAPCETPAEDATGLGRRCPHRCLPPGGSTPVSP